MPVTRIREVSLLREQPSLEGIQSSSSGLKEQSKKWQILTIYRDWDQKIRVGSFERVHEPLRLRLL